MNRAELQIRDGIRKALSLSGYTEETIDEVFNIMPDTECPMEEDPYWGESIVYTNNSDIHKDINYNYE